MSYYSEVSHANNSEALLEIRVRSTPNKNQGRQHNGQRVLGVGLRRIHSFMFNMQGGTTLCRLENSSSQRRRTVWRDLV